MLNYNSCSNSFTSTVSLEWKWDGILGQNQGDSLQLMRLNFTFFLLKNCKQWCKPLRSKRPREQSNSFLLFILCIKVYCADFRYCQIGFNFLPLNCESSDSFILRVDTNIFVISKARRHVGSSVVSAVVEMIDSDDVQPQAIISWEASWVSRSLFLLSNYINYRLVEIFNSNLHKDFATIT